MGGERGPAIVSRIALRNDADLFALLRDGVPAAGMPGTNATPKELQDLIAHLRTLRPRGDQPEQFEAGGIRGIVRNKSDFDMQVEGNDGAFI